MTKCSSIFSKFLNPISIECEHISLIFPFQFIFIMVARILLQLLSILSHFSHIFGGIFRGMYSWRIKETAWHTTKCASQLMVHRNQSILFRCEWWKCWFNWNQIIYHYSEIFAERKFPNSVFTNNVQTEFQKQSFHFRWLQRSLLMNWFYYNIDFLAKERNKVFCIILIHMGNKKWHLAQCHLIWWINLWIQRIKEKNPRTVCSKQDYRNVRYEVDSSCEPGTLLTYFIESF